MRLLHVKGGSILGEACAAWPMESSRRFSKALHKETYVRQMLPAQTFSPPPLTHTHVFSLHSHTSLHLRHTRIPPLFPCKPFTHTHRLFTCKSAYYCRDCCSNNKSKDLLFLCPRSKSIADHCGEFLGMQDSEDWHIYQLKDFLIRRFINRRIF